jgi:hypothetical protein
MYKCHLRLEKNAIQNYRKNIGGVSSVQSGSIVATGTKSNLVCWQCGGEVAVVAGTKGHGGAACGAFAAQSWYRGAEVLQEQMMFGM